MFVYMLDMYIEGRYTFVSIFEGEPEFTLNLNMALEDILQGVDTKTIACCDGVVVESKNRIENFEGVSFPIWVNDTEVEFRVRNRHWVY